MRSGKLSQNQRVATQPAIQRNIDDQGEDEEDEDYAPEEDFKEHQEERKEEDMNIASQVRVSDASKKNLKDLARRLWLAVEIGDKMTTLKLLQA